MAQSSRKLSIDLHLIWMVFISRSRPSSQIVTDYSILSNSSLDFQMQSNRNCNSLFSDVNVIADYFHDYTEVLYYLQCYIIV